MEAAKRLLQEEEAAGLQDVHSAKSVAALLKAAMGKIGQVKQGAQTLLQARGIVEATGLQEPVVINEPKIVVHDPDEGTRLSGKNTVSNLPYMHRNPAV
jgi:hypothetical protein